VTTAVVAEDGDPAELAAEPSDADFADAEAVGEESTSQIRIGRIIVFYGSGPDFDHARQLRRRLRRHGQPIRQCAADNPEAIGRVVFVARCNSEHGCQWAVAHNGTGSNAVVQCISEASMAAVANSAVANLLSEMGARVRVPFVLGFGGQEGEE